MVGGCGIYMSQHGNCIGTGIDLNLLFCIRYTLVANTGLSSDSIGQWWSRYTLTFNLIFISVLSRSSMTNSISFTGPLTQKQPILLTQGFSTAHAAR